MPRSSHPLAYRPAHSLALCLALILFACGQPGSGDAANTAAPRPNVVIILADDLTQSVLGAYGSSAGVSPHIDALAASGVVFENAAASSPFCTPSRQSLLTGRWPHAVGVTQVRSVLDESFPTLADVFAGAGYRTAALGKMHWQRKRFPNQSHGFQRVADSEEWQAQLTPGELAALEEHSALWKGRKARGGSQFNLDGVPLGIAAERQYAAWLVDQTQAFVAEDTAAPFLAFCSFNEPHPPFIFPESFAARRDPAGVQLPDVVPGELERNAPGIVELKSLRESEDGPMGAEDRRNAVASYLTSTAWVDSQVGRLLAELPPSTIVVFASDHGFLTGQHGLLSKSTPFEEVLEPPLIVRAPGLEPARSRSLVQLMDVFPTVCELAGLPLPGPLDARSFADILRDPSRPARTHTMSELMGLWGAVRTPDWKLVLGASESLGLDQLYDLRSDPGERINLVSDPAHSETLRDLFLRLGASLAESPPSWLAANDPWIGGAPTPAQVRSALSLTEPAK